MKVLHVNIGDKQGDAAIAAYRLNAVLRIADAGSGILACNKIIVDNSVIAPGSTAEKTFVKMAN